MLTRPTPTGLPGAAKNAPFDFRSALLAALALALSLATPRPLHAQTEESAPAAPETPSTWTPESVRSELTTLQEQLGALPGAASPETPDGQRKTALERRITLLEELADLIESETQLESIVAGIPDRQRAAAEQASTLEADPDVTPPTDPTKDAFAELRERVDKRQQQVTALRTRLGDLSTRQAAIPKMMSDSRAREDEAQRRAERISAEGPGDANSVAALRLENARLDREIARRRVALLEDETNAASDREAVLQSELDVAEQELARLEERSKIYSEALTAKLDEERAQMEEDVRRSQEAVESATDPVERFFATQEARIATSRKQKSDIEARLVPIQADVTEQKKRATTAKDELAGLRDFLRRAGSSGKAAERIKITYRQIPLRRKVLNRSLRGGFVESINDMRARRFEIEDMLFTLKDEFAAERELLTSGFDESAAEAFEARAEEVETRLRTALREERSVINDAISLGEQLQMAYLERLTTLDELDSFIRSKVLWIRDGKPLGPEALAPLDPESKRLLTWARSLGDPDVRSALAAEVLSLRGLLVGVVFVALLPFALFWVRQRLRRFVITRNDKTLDRGRASIGSRLLAVGVGILSAAIVPGYILLLTQFVRASELPNGLAPLLALTLGHLAWTLFAFFLVRSFFAGRSITHVQFDFSREAGHSLYASARIILLGTAVWLLLYRVLKAPPFEFEALPRIAYTLFLVTTAFAMFRLFRPDSAFVHQGLTSGHLKTLRRYRGAASALISLLVLAVVVLDIAGFRYGAASLARSLILTLLASVVLLIGYGALATIVRTVAARKRENGIEDAPTEGVALAEDGESLQPASTDPAKDDEPTAAERAARVELQILRFLRVVFVVLAVVLIARFWGIDQRALGTFDQMVVYTITGVGDAEDYVTVADFIRFAFIVIGTVWVLRSLPGIYEFALFPRLKVDAGIKYAILTISRYGLFAAGVIMGLSAIHLDLGRLGWLMAAMGVGLGFGLQEIVSNFVSGIILLIERPIQVGDLVTVGNMSGRVTRINIRATTIMNFDRQEVLLPNRSLITREVTNWTRGDTINRLIIPIGVSYDADPEEVSKVLLEIAKADDRVMTDPGPQVLFMAHGASSLDFELRCFVPNPGVKLDLMDSLNKTINREFRKRGIEIPYPQRDLHIRSSAVSLSDIRKEDADPKPA